MSKDFIPEGQELFHSWESNFMKKLDEMGAEELMPPPEYHALVKLWDDYEKKYAVAEDPTTKTSIAIHARNKARSVFEKDLRRIIKACIINNLKVTDEQRKALGLPIYKTTHTPSPVAKTFPWSEPLTNLLRHIIVEYGQSNKERSKPEGQQGVELIYVLSDVKPTSLDQLIRNESDTCTPVYLEFTEEERGCTFWYSLRWVNTRGKKGPWGPILSAIVP
ncbi:MAG: hypothetical protein LBS54_09335 [Dysgonamonadaceae bacterium]|jgi:hypothetical protein|nr:hypothetical protein [Dysgonamonadaceae bacterium]